jgi:hypothetical protein
MRNIIKLAALFFIIAAAFRIDNYVRWSWRSLLNVLWIFEVIIIVFGILSFICLGLMGYNFLRGKAILPQFLIGIYETYFCVGLSILLSLLIVKYQKMKALTDTIDFFAITIGYFLLLSAFTFALSKNILYNVNKQIHRIL